MKKVLFAASLFLITITILCCTKTDNTGVKTSTTHNGFTVNEAFYNTENAGIHIAHDTFALIFYSTAVSFNINEQHWKGTGHAVEFDELIADNLADGFPTGNFVFSEDSQANCFTDGLAMTNFNFQDHTGIERECVRGNINISKTGDQFVIAYNLKCDDSASVAGEFKGQLQDITHWFIGKKQIQRRSF